MKAYKNNGKWFIDVTNNQDFITSELIQLIRKMEGGKKDFLTNDKYYECMVYSDNTVECFAKNGRVDIITLIGYEGD